MGFFRKKSSKNPKPKKDPTIDMPTESTPETNSPQNPKKKNIKRPRRKARKQSPRRGNSPKRDKSPKAAKEPRDKSPKKKRFRDRIRLPISPKSKTGRSASPKHAPKSDNAIVIHPTANKILYPPLYFRDGVHRVDFILVTSNRIVGNLEFFKTINNYVENLKTRHLLYEFEHGKVISNLFFIKICVTDKFIHDLATEYHINLTQSNPNYNLDKDITVKWLQNDLNAPFSDNPIYSRSSSVAGDRPSYTTDAERSMIVHKVMAETSYGAKGNEFGHNGLIMKGIFIDAYPLHDQVHHWTKEGPLSDRQLLRKYWASLRQIAKIQPLNLIEKYFGTDNAFYFAWVGFYIKMLSLASIMGLLFFICGSIFFLVTGYDDTHNEVCNSTITLCPICKDFRVCKFMKLKDSCNLMMVSYFFDNDITNVFAIIMSLWSTLFLVYWKRYEARLRFRWNVCHLAVDTSLRYEYLEVATNQKTLSNGEPYVTIPKVKKYFHLILTYSTCIFMVIIIIAVLFGYIIYRLGVRYSIYISKKDGMTKQTSFIVSITGSILIYCFIGIFGKIYASVALILTRFEYHRTELEHDNSYLYKMAALSFANNYAAITYLAFFKGKFYTHPGNDDNVHVLFGLGKDLCDPAGCLIDLTIQLASIMISRSIVSLADQFIIPYLRYKFNKLRYHRKKTISVPQWEEEFVLSRTSKYYLFYEWTSMLVQYGFVTFYVAALPLAPIIAWLNNVIELRIDAIKLITTSRRPVAHRTPGIGPYKGVLKAMTIVGIATNAFVLAFTTDLIPRFLFTVSDDTNNYRKAKLSKYSLSDFPNYTPSEDQAEETVCYYPGHRHPPGHAEQYTLNETFWIELAVRFAFVIIFEHVLVTFTGILAYIIPKQALSLQIETNEQEIVTRQAKNEILNKEREKKKARRKKHFSLRASSFKSTKSNDPSMV